MIKNYILLCEVGLLLSLLLLTSITYVITQWHMLKALSIKFCIVQDNNTMQSTFKAAVFPLKKYSKDCHGKLAHQILNRSLRVTVDICASPATWCVGFRQELRWSNNYQLIRYMHIFDITSDWKRKIHLQRDLGYQFKSPGSVKHSSHAIMALWIL